MLPYPPSLQKLVKELGKLPSIGEKTALRLAYHLINNDRPLAETLGKAIDDAMRQIKFCAECYSMTEEEVCSICKDSRRDGSVLCVVEKPVDMMAIERVGEFRGLYHVLHGLWAPLRGMGPESMKLSELVARIKAKEVKEVILATSSTVEGDATALYVARVVGDMKVKSTRLAQGLPKGGELEYTDDVTLSRAFSGRSTI